MAATSWRQFIRERLQCLHLASASAYSRNGVLYHYAQRTIRQFGSMRAVMAVTGKLSSTHRLLGSFYIYIYIASFLLLIFVHALFFYLHFILFYLFYFPFTDEQCAALLDFSGLKEIHGGPQQTKKDPIEFICLDIWSDNFNDFGSYIHVRHICTIGYYSLGLKKILQCNLGN